MGRKPCCEKVGLKKGPWTAEEDKKLINFILTNGQCCWRAVPKLAGLLRCGKSCRLRWTNYLRPDLKRGLLSEHEEQMVIDLHAQLGNRWSKIASHLAGRTDNEIKNHWNTHIKKKLRKMGIDPLTHKPLSTIEEPHDQQQQLQPEEEQQEQQNNNNNNNKEVAETLLESTITEVTREEEKSTLMFDPMEVMINSTFCTDEVPLIEPDEILVPSSCSSSSSSSSSYGSNNNSNLLEELQLLDFEWQLGLWDNDDFTTWDLDPPRTVLDQDYSWTIL